MNKNFQKDLEKIPPINHMKFKPKTPIKQLKNPHHKTPINHWKIGQKITQNLTNRTIKKHYKITKDPLIPTTKNIPNKTLFLS